LHFGLKFLNWKIFGQFSDDSHIPPALQSAELYSLFVIIIIITG